MRTSSCKAKGRRLCSEVVEALLACAPMLTPDDVRVTPSGVTGEDLMMSARAKEIFPYAWEMKCQETLGIWAALAQAGTHAIKSGLPPALVFRRNHSKTYVTIELEEFIKLVKPKEEAHHGQAATY